MAAIPPEVTCVYDDYDSPSPPQSPTPSRTANKQAEMDFEAHLSPTVFSEWLQEPGVYVVTGYLRKPQVWLNSVALNQSDSINPALLEWGSTGTGADWDTRANNPLKHIEAIAAVFPRHLTHPSNYGTLNASNFLRILKNPLQSTQECSLKAVLRTPSTTLQMLPWRLASQHKVCFYSRKSLPSTVTSNS